MMRSLGMIVVGVTAMTACKKGPPKLEDVMKEYKAPVEAKIAAAEKAITTPLPAGTQALAIAEPVQLHNLWGDSTKPVQGNATLLHGSTVGYLTNDPYASVKFPGAEVLNLCASIVKKGKMLDGKDVTGFWAERPMTTCSKLRWVFVVEEKQITKPAVNEASKTFTPGSYSAMLHGYDLDKGAYVGSVSVAAKLDGKVDNFRGKGYGGDAVDGKFMSAAYTEIENALRKAIPKFDAK